MNLLEKLAESKKPVILNPKWEELGRRKEQEKPDWDENAFEDELQIVSAEKKKRGVPKGLNWICNFCDLEADNISHFKQHWTLGHLKST